MHNNNKSTSSSSTTTKTISRIVMILTVILLFSVSISVVFPLHLLHNNNSLYVDSRINILKILRQSNEVSQPCSEDDADNNALIWCDGVTEGKVARWIAKKMFPRGGTCRGAFFRNLLSNKPDTLRWKVIPSKLELPTAETFGLVERKSQQYDVYPPLKSEGTMECMRCPNNKWNYWLEFANNENTNSRKKIQSSKQLAQILGLPFISPLRLDLVQKNEKETATLDDGEKKALFLIASTMWIQNWNEAFIARVWEPANNHQAKSHKPADGDEMISGYLIYIPASRECPQWCKDHPRDRDVFFVDAKTGDVSFVVKAAKNVMTALCID